MKKKFIWINSLFKSILVMDRKSHTICHQFWLTNAIELKILLAMSVKFYPYLCKYKVILRTPSCCFYKNVGLEELKRIKKIYLFIINISN